MALARLCALSGRSTHSFSSLSPSPFLLRPLIYRMPCLVRLYLISSPGSTPFSVPRYLHLDSGRQTQRNVARFRLHSHGLRVKTRSWAHHDGTCDKCGLQAIQDKKHALFQCPCMQMCSLRLQFADLFHDLPLAYINHCQSDWIQAMITWSAKALTFIHIL